MRNIPRRLVEIQAALGYWSDRALAAAPFGKVPPVERDKFWSWLAENDWLNDWLIGPPVTHAAELSVEASLSASPKPQHAFHTTSSITFAVGTRSLPRWK